MYLSCASFVKQNVGNHCTVYQRQATRQALDASKMRPRWATKYRKPNMSIKQTFLRLLPKQLIELRQITFTRNWHNSFDLQNVNCDAQINECCF